MNDWLLFLLPVAGNSRDIVVLKCKGNLSYSHSNVTGGADRGYRQKFQQGIFRGEQVSTKGWGSLMASTGNSTCHTSGSFLLIMRQRRLVWLIWIKSKIPDAYAPGIPVFSVHYEGCGMITSDLNQTHASDRFWPSLTGLGNVGS